MQVATALTQFEPAAQGDQPWQAVLDSAEEGIWGVGTDGNCTFVNRAALRMLGHTAEDFIGKNMHDIVHHHYPDGRPFPSQDWIVNSVFRRNQPFNNQVDHLFRKDGTLFWIELSAQPVFRSGTLRGAVVTFRDITQSRLAEEALRRSEKLAAVGQLASSIAHEINNPLESVTNLLYLMRTSDTLNDVKTYAMLAEQEVARVANITTQTLRFHRQQTAAAAVQLHETIDAVLLLYAARFASRGIALKPRLTPTPPAMLFEGDIRQVLNNLVRNAFDAMPRGGSLNIRLRPAICTHTGAPGLRITVADTGTGFLPAMRQYLFEPFHTSKEVIGTGLGLWISKGIIDKHHGRIHMRSAMGRGTVFTIWLPLG